MATGATRASAHAAPHLDGDWLRHLVADAGGHPPSHRVPRRAAGGGMAWPSACANWARPTRGSSPSRCTAPSGGHSAWPPPRASPRGIAALRGRRALAATLGRRGGRGRRRRPAPGRPAAALLLAAARARPRSSRRCGPPDAERTVVLVAHHDAAHAGLLFHPAVPEAVFGRFPWLIERVDTSPPLMAPVVAVPLLVGAGALTGSRALVKAGTGLAALSVAALADIGPAGRGPRGERQRDRRGGAAGDRARARGTSRPRACG